MKFGKFFSLVALLGIFCFASNVNAAITVSNLAANAVNELEDDDFETLINAGGSIAAPGADLAVNPGDFLAGIVRITSLRVPPGGPQVATASDTERTITGVFLQKVLSVSTPLGGGLADNIDDVVFTLGAPTAAEWSTVLGIAVVAPSGTIGRLFEDPNNIIHTTTQAAGIASVGGTLLWEIGFTGVGGVATGNETWTAATDTANIATAFSLGTGSFDARVNVTAYGAGMELTPFAALLGGPTAQVHLLNGSIGSPASGSAFPVSSDVDILIKPVPEPSAMIVWGGLAVAGLAIRRRIRK